MSEESIQDFIAVLNVTINGLESMGRLGCQVTRGTLNMTSRMVSVAKWVGTTFSSALSNDTKVGGKLKNKTIARKFSDLRFSEMPLFSPAAIHKQLNEEYPGNYNLGKIEKLLSPEVLQKEFEKLSKKCGFFYSRVPNFVPDKQTGVVEFRFSYSVSQTQAKDEIISQMQAYIAKQLMKCGAKKQAAQEISKRTTEQENMPFVNSLNHIDVEKITEDQFDIIMEKTYPDYQPEKISAIEPTAAQKREYQQMLELQNKPVKVQSQPTIAAAQSETKQIAMTPTMPHQPAQQKK